MYNLFLISFLMVLMLNVGAEEKLIQRSASITVSDTVADPGGTAGVSVTASGFGNINTFESRISFNPEVLDFISISDLNPAINNAVTNLIGDSIFVISWFRFPAQYIADDEILFNLHFEFCCNFYTCAENETESPVAVIENTAFIGLFNPDFTFTQTLLDHTDGAVFSPTPLRIITIDQTGEGTVLVNDLPYEQAVVVQQNSEVTLEALPDNNYVFSEWSGDLSGIENPASFLIMNHMHIVANFSFGPTGPFDFIIDVTGAGNVHVNGSPYTEPLFFYHTDAIYMEATANEGSVFSGWYDENNNLISDEHEHIFIMPENHVSITALFSLQTFIITATAGEGGSISPAGTVSTPSGSDLTFSITPNEGFKIAGVTVDDVSVGTPNQYTFSNVTANHTIHASFEPDEIMPPENRSLTDITVQDNESFCFDAIKNITVGGNFHEDCFIVENGGEVWLIAGESIRLLPGTRVENGGYLHASISTVGVFCHGSVIKHTDEQPVADLHDVVEPVKLKTEPIFKMFPNPASATVTIIMSDKYVNDHAILEIYGIGGQRVINKLLTGSVEHVVDIAGLRPGIYLVRLLTDKHAEHQRLIIK